MEKWNSNIKRKDENTRNKNTGKDLIVFKEIEWNLSNLH